MSKISIIFDDNVYDSAYQSGFGFSCYVEHDKEKILFDLGGKKDIFNENANKLNLDPTQITHVIFSHKHLDHISGGEDFLKNIPDTTPVYIPSVFPELQRSKIPKNLTLIINEQNFETISEKVHILRLEGKYLSNTIFEQSLIIETENGLTVITGCAHPGIINILKSVQDHFPYTKINIIIGGMHLYHSWFLPIHIVCRKLKKMGIQKVAACHCSGKKASSYFKKHFGDNFLDCGAGKVIEF